MILQLLINGIISGSIIALGVLGFALVYNTTIIFHIAYAISFTFHDHYDLDVGMINPGISHSFSYDGLIVSNNQIIRIIVSLIFIFLFFIFLKNSKSGLNKLKYSHVQK